MRITVSHSKSKEEATRIVDRSFNDLFRGIGGMPLQITNQQKVWNGSVLNFSFDVKASFLNTPIKGTIEVNDKDVTIDANLGLFTKLFPAKRAKAVMEGQIRGLLT